MHTPPLRAAFTSLGARHVIRRHFRIIKLIPKMAKHKLNSIILLIFNVISVFSQIDYYQNEWSVPFRVWEAINEHQLLCQHPKKEYYNGTIEKFVVSTYIGRFKYTGVDPRPSTTSTTQNSFQGYFPRPIDHCDPHIKRACEISSEDCVHHTFLRLHTFLVSKMEAELQHNSRQLVTISIRYISHDISPYRLFIFKTTSMYYLCYWSILIDDPINEIIWPCRNPGRKLAHPTWGRCIIDAVCPNPCCGDVKVQSTDKDCSQLAEGGSCARYVNSSESRCGRIEGFQLYRFMSHRHFFNTGPRFECQCPAQQSWDGDSMMCLDEDECMTGQHRCDTETQYCVNRVRGYFCVCRFGFKPSETHKCIPTK